MKNNKYKLSALLIIIILTIQIIISSCNNEVIPKPKGYFRIDMPDVKYKSFDSIGYPYTFEVPTYANVVNPVFDGGHKYPFWINVDFKPFNATLFLSYRKIEDNLDTLLNDSWNFTMKHVSKADGIETSNFVNPKYKIYSTIFKIDGTSNASPIQFYIIDSTNNFLRGALYFNLKPNNDSLQPVIERLQMDIQHLIETTNWK